MTPNPADAPVHPEALLLPWYDRGELSADEHSAVEAHLAVCADCRAELAADRALAGDYQAVLDRYGDAPPSVHAAVMRQVRAEAAPPAVSHPPSGLLARLAEAARALFSPQWAPAAAVAVVAVQAGLLVVMLAARPPVAPPPVEVRGLEAQAPQIEVTFRPDAPIGAVAGALRDLGGRIVDGPRADGTVTVELGGGPDSARRLAALRARTDLVQSVGGATGR